MSEDLEQKFGLEGIERDQGYERMMPANPVSNPDDIPAGIADDALAGVTSEDLEHYRRPAPPEPEEREYYNNATGKPVPANQSVSVEQASHDLTAIRDAERVAREQQSNADLASALDQTGQEQPAQQEQPQPELEPQPDGELEAARARQAGETADAIEAALQNPEVARHIEQAYTQVKQQAATEVEKAYAMSGAVRDHYVTATNNLVAEANGLLGVLYPELNGLNPDQLQGALKIMAQQQPERVQALQRLASRAQGLVEAQQRQQYEQQQGQALQQQHALEQFAAAQEKRYEEATKFENPETMKAVRSQVYNVVEKSYGITKQAMSALYSGEQRVDSAAFVRSAAFQLMLTDAVKYRLAQRGITEARSNPIPRVQRPGVAPDAKVYDGDLSAAASRFNLPGGNEGSQGLKNAAAWITARRGGR